MKSDSGNMTSESLPPPPRKSWKSLLQVGVTIALLAWVVRSIVARDGIDALVERLRTLDLRFFGLAVGLHLVAVASGTARWRLLLSSQGIELPFAWLFRRFLVGRFFGAFLPSTAGLDLYRAYAAGRATGEPVKSASTIVAEKLAGLVSMSLVCASLAPLGASRFFGAGAYVALGVIFAAALVGLFTMRRPELVKRLFSRAPAKIVRVLDAAGSLHLSGSRFAQCIALGMIAHLAQSSVFVATGAALGLHVSSLTLLVVGNAIVVGVLVPISVGGLGVRESIAMMLLAAVHVGAADAALVGLLGWLSGQMVAALGGLVNVVDRRALERGDAVHCVQHSDASTTPSVLSVKARSAPRPGA